MDDDSSVRGVVAAGLRSAGFAVWAADGGSEAVALYRANREAIAVVLMDVCMPGMDGPETMAALRHEAPALACWFMTGHSGSYSSEDLLAIGSGVLRKPFPLADASRVLRETIAAADRDETLQDDRWRDDGGQGHRPTERPLFWTHGD